MKACQPKRRKEERERKRESENTGERERDPRPFGSSFYLLFPPLGLPYVNWDSQECCLFYLRSSLQFSDLPLFYFHRLFPSLSFSHHHSGLLFCNGNHSSTLAWRIPGTDEPGGLQSTGSQRLRHN